MLFAIKRQLESAGCPVVFIPCQEELDTLDWKGALYRVTENVRRVLDLDSAILAADAAYEEDGANVFGEDMDAMLQGRSTPVVLMFDEIEAITFSVGDAKGHWYDGNSFIHF